MKQLYTSIFSLAIILFLTCCSTDMSTISSSDEKQELGTFFLSLTNDDVHGEVITRAKLGLDVANFQVTLTEEDGTSILEGKLFGSFTESDYTLPSATGYQLKAESCTPDEANTLNEGWGMPHFIGSATFDILPNQHTQVSLNCTMKNVGLKVIFSSEFLNKFPTHAFSTLDNRRLVFNQDTQEQIAYLPVDGETISLKVRLSGSAGGWSDRLDVSYELVLSKGKIYTVNVDYSSNQVRCRVK